MEKASLLVVFDMPHRIPASGIQLVPERLGVGRVVGDIATLPDFDHGNRQDFIVLRRHEAFAQNLDDRLRRAEGLHNLEAFARWHGDCNLI